MASPNYWSEGGSKVIEGLYGLSGDVKGVIMVLWGVGVCVIQREKMHLT